jgi:glyoxylase-like metal-dependent hydrolase (beta-lactamase superfamily II)
MSNISIHKKALNNIFQVAPGVWGMRDVFVNVYMVMNPFDGNWVLVDTGLKWSSSKIRKTATYLFGNSKPSAIILTHGHFDHTGSLQELVEEWNVPVYAHFLEIPYLTGKSAYPPADPFVGGGLMSLLSWAYPRGPINIWNHINVLPDNGGVPGLPEWKYIHTPGHTPGHISLFRENDGVLIAGDALVTTKSESFIAVMLGLKELNGPPKYFTSDWAQARRSVNDLVNLEPQVIASGHGVTMKGNEIRSMLQDLAERFYSIAVPASGRYVNEPAVADASGIVYVPENNVNKTIMIIRSLAVIAMATTAFLLFNSKQKQTKKIKDALAYEVW